MFFERILLPVFCLGINVFLWISAEEVQIRQISADKGKNVTIICADLIAPSGPNVLWVHKGIRTHHQVLNDGSLYLTNVDLEDAGLYECGIENESTYLDRINLTVEMGSVKEVEIREVPVDKGTDVTIPCGGLLELIESGLNVLWVHKGSRTHHEILKDGGLFLTHINVDDAGLYECGVDNESGYIDRVNLTVRTEPPALVNVTVHASTILALILWNVAGDGGHPIIDFTAQYRSAAPVNGSLEPWRPISPNHISPNSRQIDVYHLEPNASYWFRVWATNVLGPGPSVEVLATTLYSDQEAELYKHFLAGAESFDTRTWVAAVCVVMGTLVLLAAGTTAVLCREWRRADRPPGEHP